MMKRSGNIVFRVDWLTIVVYLIMVFLGWLNIYAAVYDEQHSNILNFSQRYGKQLVWVLAALVIALFTLLIDNRFYFFFAWFIYGGVLLLLLLVLIAGREINGAKSWFEFGGLRLQPSEFAKFATALALARYLHSGTVILTRSRYLLAAAAIFIAPALLIVLQPDMGSAIVFIALFFVLFREGMSPYIFVTGILMIVLFLVTLVFEDLYITLALILIAFILGWLTTGRFLTSFSGLIIIAVLTGVGWLTDRLIINTLSLDILIIISLFLSALIFAWYIYRYKLKSILVIYLFLLGSVLFVYSVDYAFNNLLKPHQQTRINIVLGIESDPLGTGYNLNQSLISIGSGGLTGKGYLQGTQTKFRFVPEQSTDFIFCTVGEEWGFLGSLVIIGLYLLLLFRLQRLAERQKSAFARIYGYGVFSILFIHVFINIGMTIGLVPVIGIPLPFLSYGGSSLWGFTILLFLFLRLDASRTEYLL
ncbi:MAG: rod shape-determining protein RodA [Bacteroidales bacterium]|nr:rod shape-determining protein RodA [Bacteroidales bacterium]